MKQVQETAIHEGRRLCASHWWFKTLTSHKAKIQTQRKQRRGEKSRGAVGKKEGAWNESTKQENTWAERRKERMEMLEEMCLWGLRAAFCECLFLLHGAQRETGEEKGWTDASWWTMMTQSALSAWNGSLGNRRVRLTKCWSDWTCFEGRVTVSLKINWKKK